MALRQRHYAIVEPCLLGHQPLETGIDLRRTPNQPLETELGALFAFELPFEGVIGRITAGDERDHAIQGSNAAYHRAPRAPARRCTSRWPATAAPGNRAHGSRAHRRCARPSPHSRRKRIWHTHTENHTTSVAKPDTATNTKLHGRGGEHGRQQRQQRTRHAEQHGPHRHTTEIRLGESRGNQPLLGQRPYHARTPPQ